MSVSWQEQLHLLAKTKGQPRCAQSKVERGLGWRPLCFCHARQALALLSEGALETLFLPPLKLLGTQPRGNTLPDPFLMCFNAPLSARGPRRHKLTFTRLLRNEPSLGLEQQCRLQGECCEIKLERKNKQAVGSLHHPWQTATPWAHILQASFSSGHLYARNFCWYSHAG